MKQPNRKKLDGIAFLLVQELNKAPLLKEGSLLLSRYVLQKKIGKGGMGEVFKAHDQSLNRTVALKVIKPGILLPGVMARFKREAHALAKINHPNVVKIFDSGGDEHMGFFMAMEFVEGKTLRELLDQRQLSQKQLIEILEKVARGIGVAHKEGVTHRDVKPENIFVDPFGEPKVGDFGIAGIKGTENKLTQTHEVLGTPLYMSPEQVEGWSKAFGPWTDVYQLGVILYEGLSGERPNKGKSLLEIYDDVASNPYIPLRSKNKKISLELESVCFKALRKRPEDRYPNATKFADDLYRFRNNIPVEAKPVSRFERFKTQLLYRKEMLWGLGMGVGAFLCLLFLGGYLLQMDEDVKTVNQEHKKAKKVKDEQKFFVDLEMELELLRHRFYQRDYRLIEKEFKKYEELIKNVKRLMEGGNEKAQGWYLIGRCEEVLGLSQEAIQSYEQAIELNPNHGPSHFWRAKIYFREALIVRFNRPPMKKILAKKMKQAQYHLSIALKEGVGKEMDQDLALGYEKLAQGKSDREFYNRMAQKWKEHDFYEEFYLLDALANTKKGIAQFSEAIKIRPGYTEALFWRGIYQITKKKMDKGISNLTQALEINPRSPHILVSRADAKIMLKNYSGALTDYDRAILIAPSMFRAIHNRGLLKLNLKDYDGALEDFNRCLTLHPHDWYALFNRGMAKAAKRDPVGSNRDLDRVAEMSPTFFRTYFTRGLNKVSLKDYQGALNDFNEALRLRPNHALSYFRRGMAKSLLKDRQGAISDYNKAIRFGYKKVDVYIYRGEEKFYEGEYSGAIEDYDVAITQDPKNIKFLLKRGIAKYQLGGFKGAIRDYNEALRLSPKNTVGFYNRGLAKVGNGDYRDAMKDFDEVLRIDPKYLVAYYSRGYVKKKVGDISGAIDDYKNALKLSPEDWEHRNAVEEEIKVLQK